MIDTGVHVLYLLRGLAGEARAVSASMSHMLRDEMEGEDNSLLTIEYASGALGEVAVSYSTRLATWQLGFPDGWDQHIEVYGETGTLKLDLVHGRLELYSQAAATAPETKGWSVAGKGIGGMCEWQLPNVYFDSFKYAVKHFAESVLADCVPSVTGRGWPAAGAGRRCRVCVSPTGLQDHCRRLRP